jgi:hypothetical protein
VVVVDVTEVDIVGGVVVTAVVGWGRVVGVVVAATAGVVDVAVVGTGGGRGATGSHGTALWHIFLY